MDPEKVTLIILDPITGKVIQYDNYDDWVYGMKPVYSIEALPLVDRMNYVFRHDTADKIYLFPKELEKEIEGQEDVYVRNGIEYFRIKRVGRGLPTQ